MLGRGVDKELPGSAIHPSLVWGLARGPPSPICSALGPLVPPRGNAGHVGDLNITCLALDAVDNFTEHSPRKTEISALLSGLKGWEEDQKSAQCRAHVAKGRLGSGGTGRAVRRLPGGSLPACLSRPHQVLSTPLGLWTHFPYLAGAHSSGQQGNIQNTPSWIRLGAHSPLPNQRLCRALGPSRVPPASETSWGTVGLSRRSRPPPFLRACL